tara:strand:- start:384 stop:722 length:339 start_codon:yes stop_codon:yes gene_type:complete
VRHPQGAIAKRITEVGEDAICTSIIIAAELCYGAAKKGSERLTRQLDAILSLDAPMDEAYAAIRTHLERAGTPIGGNDLLIAAQARSLCLTVITANVGEFSRVPDLAIESWL